MKLNDVCKHNMDHTYLMFDPEYSNLQRYVKLIYAACKFQW